MSALFSMLGLENISDIDQAAVIVARRHNYSHNDHPSHVVPRALGPLIPIRTLCVGRLYPHHFCWRRADNRAILAETITLSESTGLWFDGGSVPNKC